MKTEQMRWTQEGGWEPAALGGLGAAAQLALLFWSPSVLKEQQLDEIRQAYPNAHLFGCSTFGEIYNTQLFDDSLVVTAIQFEDTQVKGLRIKRSEGVSSFELGERLAKEFDKTGLVHVLVLADTLHINGSELAAGLANQLPAHVAITGGGAGDGDRLQEPFVLWDSMPEQETVAAVGFYGDRLRVGYGASGGWDPFGPERLITRSQGNVLYELDGKPTLQLYKTYLGEYAQGLPATGMLFPLGWRIPASPMPVINTVVAVGEDEQSMTFAGNMPEGVFTRFMRANFTRLIDAASDAAKTSYEAIGSSPDLALLISCACRRLVLKQRTEEEVEGVREVLGEPTVLTGFYSLGQVCPFRPGTPSHFHSQTMTITTFFEE